MNADSGTGAPPRKRDEVDTRRRSRDRSWPDLPDGLPSPVVDNHCHLDFSDGEHALDVEEQIHRAAEVGVERIITIGCELDSARWTAELLAREPRLSGGVAIHPNDAVLHVRGTDRHGREAVSLDEAIAEIAGLLRGPGMVVVGETGLDWFRTSRRDEAARAAQFESFRAHIALAKELDLPMQIHDRDAHRDVLDVLASDGAPELTVFHCFSGDAEMARECVEHGYYLSFAGTVTFSNASDLREALALTPLDRVLVETDAPFLTPVPYRGRPNASYLVPLTMRMIADVKGVDLETACRVVRANTRAVYGV
ncbi:TatD family hydrolase [Devriesea agamarum]|uniref:TatD family hydrolase n=1 Tax=Devriesea agamarum TaxID=472569 RepID=UPI000A02DCE4|nr:TatD family hydrolase [Devriesea agamarum]